MAEEQRPRRWVRTAKLVVFALTPALLLVVIAETIGTLSISRRALVLPDSTTGRSVYTLRIGKWPWSRRTTTPLNSMGFPDAEFPQRGPKNGCTHIVLAGDSFIFGDGVDRDSSFVEIVRRQTLARPDGRCVKMFNISVRGTTIDRQAAQIMETFDRLQPDIVVVGQYQNDLIDLNSPGAILDPRRPAPGVKAPGDSIRVRLRLFQANIIKMLTYRLFAYFIQNGIERDVLRHWSVMADSSKRDAAILFQQTYAKLYGELAAGLAARGVAFGVVILPSKLDIMAKRYPEEAFFLELARRHNVPHLRIFPVLHEQRKPYAFLLYDGHLSEHGNRVIARSLYDWLFETEPAPFPALRRAPARD